MNEKAGRLRAFLPFCPPALQPFFMSLSTVLFLFLAHLAVGIAFTLVFVSRDAGVKFFRFNAGLAAILLAVALAFRYGAFGATLAEQSRMNRIALLALDCAEAALVLYWATIGRMLARVRPVIVAIAVLAGLAAVVLQAICVSADRSVAVQVLTVASFLTSAAMLGGACTAMILGHWYLVIPSLPVSHLQSIVRGHIASMATRVAVVGVAVWCALSTSIFRPDGDLGPSFRHYITSVDGIFFWQRVLFGLAGPAVLSYLTWETAKIRSTQSATGILYVDFFTVVVGEVLAKYIVLATHVPV
jgi:protein NrfD